MTTEEAIYILDPETTREALAPYAYDPERRVRVVEEACGVVCDALHAQQQSNAPLTGWIRVKERLPEDPQTRVLVRVDKDKLDGLIGSPDIDTDRFCKGRWVRWGEHVTHWMPLPKPPEEGTR